MKIYNTLTKKKETLEVKERINLFVCGPTVYDYPHLGHARTYVSFDAFVKFLRKTNDVFYLQNITDIDDKIIQRAEETETSPTILAKRFEEEYLKDMELLSVNSVTKYARATDYIKEIISQTERLLEKDFAYVLEDGIYYDILKFKDYGKLSGRTTAQAEDGTTRIDENVKKKNKGDFCIWKFSKNNEPEWDSPWGKGRPGWHIEDTAISEKFFGVQYDVHGGGRDLMFPHHEAEITIMEAVSGKVPFVRYWMHTGFLTVQGVKMSKSLKNFTTIRDFTEKHSPRILRFLILKSHYRSPFDYDEEKTAQAIQELKKIDQFIANLKENNTKEEITKDYREKITQALNDDFNTPVAIATLFSFITKANLKIDKLNKEEVETFLKEIDSIFNFIYATKEETLLSYEENIPEEIKTLVDEREEAREKKDFKRADDIRKEIEKRGYLVEDTKDGFKIKKYE
jgi:cysteinyl-tRNA synthetase